jgi:hypothetical protein
MIRWYVWPVQEVEIGDTLYRGPKYLKWRQNPDGVDVRWKAMDYGLMPTMLLVADVTQEQHDLAAAQPDIITIPPDIDGAISPQALPLVVDALEALHIPAGWVTTAHTYRDVMRPTAHLFQLAQRYHGRTARRLIEAGYNLDTLIGDLPVNVLQSLNETAQSLGWDTSEIQASWRLRQALRHLAQQWGEAPVLFGDLGTL